MVTPIRNPWQPQVIRRVVALKETGTEVVEVVTNEGPGFVKFLGNPEGPHVLAAEFVGTRLAGAMELPILDWNVFQYDGFPEIRLPSGKLAQTGSAWGTRKVEGFVWSGQAEDLAAVTNQGDIAKLVLFDQWVLNCDRYRPAPKFRQNLNNVFFSREDSEAGKFRLLAMDHTHIFTCGGELRPDMARLDKVREPLLPSPAFERLDEILTSAPFEKLIRRDARIHVPVLDKELTVPYSYQNGRLNLIQPHRFAQKTEAKMLQDAFKTAVQGHLLFRNPLPELGECKLVVVGSFRNASPEARNRVADVLTQHEIDFFDDTQVDDLAGKILATAH